MFFKRKPEMLDEKTAENVYRTLDAEAMKEFRVLTKDNGRWTKVNFTKFEYLYRQSKRTGNRTFIYDGKVIIEFVPNGTKIYRKEVH